MYPLLTGPLTVENVTIPIRDLPDRLEGTRVVQLSDFHFDGLRLSTRLLKDAIARCNAIAPDLVVLTGDFVTDDPQPIYTLTQFLDGLRSRRGVYAVLGNHDNVTFSGRLTIIDALHKADISVLWNDIAFPFGEVLPLVGLADLWSGECCPKPIMAQLSPSVPRLVLAHNPDTADKLRNCRADLQLSGHSHGGQVLLPGLGPLPLAIRKVRPYLPKWARQHVPYLKDSCDQVLKHWEWAMGLHQLGQNQLYVNRGLGTYLPGRFRCPPELTVLTLVAAPRQA